MEAIASLQAEVASSSSTLRGELRATGAEAIALRERVDATIEGLKAEIESTRQAFFEAQSDVLTEVEASSDRDLSLAIVSTLHQLGPLIFPGDRRRETAWPESQSGGHCDLMTALVRIAHEKPGSMAGKTLVEIGSARARTIGQGSSQVLSIFTSMLGMRFTTVGTDSGRTEQLGETLPLLNPLAKAVTAKGEDYLATSTEPIDNVYLDASDIDRGVHAASRQDSYEPHLETSDDACWLIHLHCAYAIAAKMDDGGIVAINDTWNDAAGVPSGKGKLAIPFLLSNGFEIVSQSSRAVVLRRRSGGPSGKRPAREAPGDESTRAKE